jgi:predicted DNA-binding transcriptional regulator AlpA
VSSKQEKTTVVPELFDKSSAAEFFGVSVRTLSRWQHDPAFPQPIRITSTSRPRWIISEIKEYIEQKSTELNSDRLSLKDTIGKSLVQRTTRVRLPNNSPTSEWGELRRQRASLKASKGGDQ